MNLDIQNLDLGIQILFPQKNNDKRGFISEILRNDWKEFFDSDFPQQINVSKSNPGVIRAWHRHSRGQIDYFLVQKGTMKICAYDADMNSDSCGKLVEIIADEKEFKIVKIPGHLWHGTMTISKFPSETLYFLTNLYDYQNPDEERLDYDSAEIIDPKTKKPYQWIKSEKLN